MKLREPMPQAVEEKIQRFSPSADEALIRVSTDLNADGNFGEQWLVVTDNHILLVPTEVLMAW